MSIVNETISTQEIKIKANEKRKEVLGWLRFILLIVLVFVTVRYAFNVTFISGYSMAPTFSDGNIVLTNNIAYELERNDIVVFHDEGGYNVIKRIIAMPNETVEILNGIVYVNDQPISEDFIIGTPNDMEKIVVGEGSYFVMGDNREPGESLDSRDPDVGPIHKDEIKGEMLLSILPFGL